MASQVQYSMHGFNHKNRDHHEILLTDNKPFQYDNHSFLDSVFINDTITKITFFLLPSIEYAKYKNEISRELESICFNLIMNSQLSTYQPSCILESIINEDGTEMIVSDRLNIREEVLITKRTPSVSIYQSAFDKQTNFEKHEAMYKEVFWILQSPHRIIQFLGLYDMMANLIHSPVVQEKVHDYFGMNRNIYPWIKFFPSTKNPKVNEDSLTHLRNNVAHSQRIGITAYIEAAQSITEQHIKYLLTVINNLLCTK